MRMYTGARPLSVLGGALQGRSRVQARGAWPLRAGRPRAVARIRGRSL